jgi:hypothetical protein
MWYVRVMSRHAACAAALALATLTACGKKGGSDWTQRPIKTISGTVDGIAFTIDVPDGMRQKAKPDELALDFLDGEYAKSPDVWIRSGTSGKTLDDYVKSEPNVTVWLRKESLPDGYIASHENAAYKGTDDWIVAAVRTGGGKVLSCNARVTPWEPGATAKDKVPLVEKMCLSLKAK